ncbi:hypothetical protein SLE2022_376410 [Rubroshorea leprosula]
MTFALASKAKSNCSCSSNHAFICACILVVIVSIVVIMYRTASSSASTLLRARLFSSSLKSTLTSPPPSSLINHQSFSFSTVIHSLCCFIPRWSHDVDWRSQLVSLLKSEMLLLLSNDWRRSSPLWVLSPFVEFIASFRLLK